MKIIESKILWAIKIKLKKSLAYYFALYLNSSKNCNMKILKFLFLLCLPFLFITSCRKDEVLPSRDKLDAPLLIAPASGSNLTYSNGGNEDFDWADVSDANEYQIQFSLSSNFSTILVSAASSTSDIFVSNPALVNNTTYFWRVRALAPDIENSDFSEVFNFTFGNAAQASVNLVSPANNSTAIPLSQTFTCDAFPNAVTYAFVFTSSNISAFGPVSVSNSATVNLLANEIYAWYVEVTDDNGDIYTSPIWFFSTIPNQTCAICGFYQGFSSGNVQVALVGTDTTFSNLASTVHITANASNSLTHNAAIDISNLLGVPAGTLVPEFDGTLSGNTLTFTNQSYVYQGILTINMSGLLNFPTANTTSGTFNLSGDAIGTISFSGTK